jgi:hypothetical protein
MGSVMRPGEVRNGGSDTTAAMVTALQYCVPPPASANGRERSRQYRRRAEKLRAASEDVILRESWLALRNLADTYDRMAATIQTGASGTCLNPRG